MTGAPFLPDSSAADDAPPPSWAVRSGNEPGASRGYRYTAAAVTLGVDVRGEDVLALTATHIGAPFDGYDAWPESDVRWHGDGDARTAAARALSAAAGLGAPAFFETLDTYDSDGRDPRQWIGRFEHGRWVATGSRSVSKSFLALVRHTAAVEGTGAEQVPARLVRRASVYDFLPWEDLRNPSRIASVTTMLAILDRVWVQRAAPGERADRQARVATAFGAHLTQWNEERAAERLRVLMEAGLLEESRRNRWGEVAASDRSAHGAPFGLPMAFDHRLMLADALSRVRGKMKYVPAVLEALVGDPIALPDFQGACEAIGGRRLHTANFRRLVTKSCPIVEKSSRRGEQVGPGPRAALYAFRSHVAQLRLDPPMRMPWSALPPGALA